MPRQRIRTRSRALELAGRGLVVLVALALLWYGLMTLLLALKVAPGSVNSLSGYRSVYDALAGLGPGDAGGSTRAVAAAAGVLAFVVFGYLALQQVPRPYLARHALDLESDGRGSVTVAARAVERIAEQAALEDQAVDAALGRAGGEKLDLELELADPEHAVDSLRQVRAGVAAAVDRHGLPEQSVEVILAGYARRTKGKPIS